MNAEPGVPGAEGPCLEKPVLDLVPVGIFAIDPAWKVILWNRTLADWTGLDGIEVLGREARALLPSFAEPRHMARILPLFQGGPPVIFTHELNPGLFPPGRAAERERSYRTVASPLQDRRGVLFTVEDWTEQAALLAESRRELAKRREVESELRSALEVREMLGREASHRVKNNLNMIVSLIDIEIGRIEDSSSRELLSSFEARIQSIALIHDLLYKNELGSQVRVDDYLSNLCRRIFSTLLPADTPATLGLEVSPLRLDVDRTLYLGLIAVELVTNAIKYAVIPRGEGSVRVSLRDGSGGWMELSVADDGPGYSPLDAGPYGSLGRSLVSMLTSQLGGELLADGAESSGARVTVRLPVGSDTGSNSD
ncbi:MAG: PAS domain-containing protein [Treponema sp.]|nr:PAS domain-containing protein [Treponema sp.]